MVPINTFREQLTCFPYVKSFTFLHWSRYKRRRKESDTYLATVEGKRVTPTWLKWNGISTRFEIPPNFQVSTSVNLTGPPPPLLPVSPLEAPANTGVNLPLQLMKTAVRAESFKYLSTFIVIYLLQRCLQIIVRLVSLSVLHFNIFFNI